MAEELKDFMVNIKGVEFKYPSSEKSVRPNMAVAELTDAAKDALIKGLSLTGAQLGVGNDPGFEIKLKDAMVQDLQLAHIRNSKAAFILVWEGSKTPLGAQIGGHTIGRAQNGEIVSDKGESLGTYTRLLENGGESKTKQQMIAFLTAKPIEQAAK